MGEIPEFSEVSTIPPETLSQSDTNQMYGMEKRIKRERYYKKKQECRGKIMLIQSGAKDSTHLRSSCGQYEGRNKERSSKEVKAKGQERMLKEKKAKELKAKEQKAKEQKAKEKKGKEKKAKERNWKKEKRKKECMSKIVLIQSGVKDKAHLRYSCGGMYEGRNKEKRSKEMLAKEKQAKEKKAKERNAKEGIMKTRVKKERRKKECSRKIVLIQSGVKDKAHLRYSCGGMYEGRNKEKRSKEMLAKEK